MKSRILPIIAGSFGLICVLQLTNLSLAKAEDDSVTDGPAEAVGGLSKTTDMSEKALNDVCVTSSLAEALLIEQERLDERGLALAKREKALAALETKLDQQLANIQMTKDSVQTQLEQIEKIASSDLEHLISMYETMKPKKAAEIFDSMAPSFAAGFLRDMNSAKAGLIMSEMNAKTSYEISLVIANRNAELRKTQ